MPSDIFLLSNGGVFLPWKIEHHLELCIGCGACAAIAPADWIMKGDKSELVGGKKSSDGNSQHFEKIVPDDKINGNEDAAKACPVPCIFVKKI